MAITPTLYETAELIGSFEHMDDEPNYWLQFFSGGTFNFDTEWIEFEKITDAKIIAPFVSPMVRGVPIYGRGSEMRRFKPAYIKLKDPVSPGRLIKRMPGQVLQRVQPSLEQKRDALVFDINRTHRNAIRRTIEVMASKALITGQIPISGENYPAGILVQFGRASGHTITLVGAARWGQPGVDIIENINTWIALVRNATFGGVVTRVTVAPDVWAVMRADDTIRQLMDINIRGTNVSLNIGVRQGLLAEKVGMLSPNLELWVYSDKYVDTNGVLTDYMTTGQVVLTANNMQGVMTYGAIMDHDSLQAVEIFPKVFFENDPSGMFVMNQSSPLPVIINPNNTLLANVL